MKNIPINATLDNLAREMVGDGKSPNTFFVTLAGKVVLVTTDWEQAYDAWRRVEKRNQDKESALEDRKWGTICDRSPINEGSTPLFTRDDFSQFMKRFRLKY